MGATFLLAIRARGSYNGGTGKEDDAMPWIHMIDESEASGALQKVYDRLKGDRGKAANIMKIHSLDPRAMEAHLDLYLALMFTSSGVSREERELLAVAVSAANGCAYCISHHAEALNHYWKDRGKIDALLDDIQNFALPERSRRMVDYGTKLTAAPAGIGEADIARLRESGFSDDDILRINLVAAYFNFVNRIALGLGVDYSADEVSGYRR